MQQVMPRRRFLKTGCLTVAAATLTIGGIGLAMPAPEQPPVDLPSLSYGEKNVDNRVLVAYATYAGSTAEVAAAIGETLGARGFTVDVKPIIEKPTLDGYRSVLVGSAVQRGNWLPEAVEFVKNNRQALGRVPVALFTVHMTNLEDDEESWQNRLAFLNTVRPYVQPVAEVFFAGRFNSRCAALLMPGFVARFVPTFERRDWNKIRAWSQTVLA